MKKLVDIMINKGLLNVVAGCAAFAFGLSRIHACFWLGYQEEIPEEALEGLD